MNDLKKKVNNNHSFLLYFIFLLGYLIIFFTVNKLTSIATMLFYFSFFLIFVAWILSLNRKLKNIDLLAVIIVALSFVFVLINALQTNANISLDYLKKVIMFSSTIMLFSAMQNFGSHKEIEKQVLILNIILSIALFILFFAKHDDVFYWNERISDYLVFNLDNPNKAGMYLAVITIYNFCLLRHVNNVFIKIPIYAVIIMMIYLTWLTGARTAIIAIAVFVIFYYILLLKSSFKLNFSNIILFLVAILPLLFALIYMVMVENDILRDFFSFMEKDGKSLDSRYDMWNGAFEFFKGSPIFGAYSQMSNGTGQSQMHNIGVDILTSYGVMIYCLVTVFIYITLKACNNNAKYSKQIVYCLALIIAIMLGCGEAALFSGAAGYNILISGFVLFSKRDCIDK